MEQKFTVAYKRIDGWYAGWIEEVPGVNTQAKTLKELRENLKEALFLIIETNRLIVKNEVGGKMLRESIIVSV